MVNFYTQKQKNNGFVGEIKPENNEEVKIAGSFSVRKNKIKSYEDPTGEFGKHEFQWAIWYAKHSLLLYRLVVISLSVFSFLTLGFSIWKGFNILLYDFGAGRIADAQLAASIDATPLHQVYAPQPIQILNTYVLLGGTEKVDAAAIIYNPNPRHIIYFNYRFIFANKETETKNGFLLPGEQKPLVVFGLPTDEYAGNAEIVLENLQSKRISAHEIQNTDLWQSERLNFVLENLVFTPANEEQSANALRFDLTNQSAYGYKEASFVLALRQNNVLVAVMPLSLTDFSSLETRSLDLRNFVVNLSVDQMEIYPLIDLYDPEVYLPPKG